MTDIRQKLDAYAASLHISDIGVCGAREYRELLPRLDRPTPFAADGAKRISPSAMLPGARAVIMCVFNYFAGRHDGNIAKYARGMDYHKVVNAKLDALIAFLKRDYPQMRAVSFCDNSPMCDKYLAYLAGLGFWGQNSLLIHPVFGSYIVIGGIITDLAIPADRPIKPHTCAGCGRCAEACPAGAILSDGIDAFACVSHLTQKKGALPDGESETMRRCDTVWGCDICTDVCPHNAEVPTTDIVEFSNNLLCRLDTEELERLGKDRFNRVFSDKAFVWRGYDTLLRNAKIAESTD